MPFQAVSYLLGSVFFQWCTIICSFVGKFWLMVSLQWKYLCLSTFKLCLLCKLCSFCSSPALHVFYSQKVVLLQLGQVVIQWEILLLLFWEVVIQHEVVFYSFRMGSFNGGWCRKIKNACILTFHRINFFSNIYLILHAVCHSHTTKKNCHGNFKIRHLFVRC